MIRFFLALTLFYCVVDVHAQELKCVAQVQLTDQKGQSDEEVFRAIEKSIMDIMNTTKWTSDVYGAHERIDCSIFIKITENISNTEFKGEMQIQARRPVFNSSYTSSTLLINDENVAFKYNQFAPLQYTENAYTDELVALLSFYAYYILGNDYDTYEKNGGTPFFEKALNIVNLAATSSAAPGWKSNEKDENRYWLINNTLDQFYQPLRDINYSYYREGFDVMEVNLEAARKTISASLKKIEQIHATKPNNYNVGLFFYSKADELINLYKGAGNEEKVTMVQFLKKVNPANVTKYNKILTGSK